MTPIATPASTTAPGTTAATTTGRRFQRLSMSECIRLLAQGGVGRLAFLHGPTPVILPVNFVMADGVLVLRTAADTLIDQVPDGEGVAFEIDHVDLVYRHAWSVLVRGTIERITDAGELAGCELLQLGVYAPGRRDHWLRIVPATISGRGIR